MEHDLLEHILDGSMKPRDLPLSLLKNITGNFSEKRKIGEGGFGIVYRGALPNAEVAVKRIIKNVQTNDENLFRREVDSMMEVNHQNIVRFIGFCSNTEHKRIQHGVPGGYIYAEARERILCFEYISNGSLDKYITDELRGLEWDTRYNIIKGICDGLEYLHMKKHIIHMDLKPANVLLDNHMVAKITDFGLARMDGNSHTTNQVFTLGYCAPEYLLGGRMSVKSDVYSLGVIIIELVMGRRGTPDINNISPYWEDDMLGVKPLELRFPFVLNKEISCTLEVTNGTNSYIAFNIETMSPLPYCIKANKVIVPPQSKCSVNITLQPLDKVPEGKQYSDNFIIRSTKVSECLTSEDITEDMFNLEEGKVVDEVTLTVVHDEPFEPHVDLLLESLTISGTKNLNSTEKSNVPSAETESTVIKLSKNYLPSITEAIFFEVFRSSRQLCWDITITSTKNNPKHPTILVFWLREQYNHNCNFLHLTMSL
ncbi:unnamed protein product [Triticum turgidum subsp. durum]|uniref:non-specific serine/threonine protein kinase n=1 Tax=Triticum turgidum subsp. durum TaxID=4567 RepID=A0A9R1Q8U5_TRITD|nr:unnamed protein product [Triticum turgidum subsp. durum]